VCHAQHGCVTDEAMTMEFSLLIVALLIAASVLLILFKWRSKRRWSVRGRRNKPIRRLSLNG
jgi:hypothetical protein